MRQECGRDSRRKARSRSGSQDSVSPYRAELPFLVVFAIPLIFLGACNVEPGTSSLLEIDPARDVLSATEHLQRAVQESKEWRTSAYLVWIDIDIARDKAEAAYAFDNPNDPEDGFLVYVESDGNGYTMRTREVRSEGRRSVRPPIDREDWTVDSIQVGGLALQRARDFLRQHPEVAQMDIQLAGLSGSAADQVTGETGDLVWSVMFYSSPETSLDLYFDPLSGEYLGRVLRDG